MRKYIVLTINGLNLSCDYRTITNEEKSYINKNAIKDRSFFYTLNYIKKHYAVVNATLKKYNFIYNNVVINNLISFKYFYQLLSSFEVENIKLNFTSSLSLEDYDMFLSIKTLKKFDCYYMPDFVRKKFAKKDIKVTLMYFKNISERFMLQQDSFDYETLYYRKTLDIKEEYPGLINDIKEFLKINYNLKSINIYVFSKELVSSIIDLVEADESKSIIVFLHQGYDKGNFITSNFEWLKILNKKCKDKYICEFRIVYSNSFLKNNLFKQLTFNNLKLITTMCIYICIVSLIIVKSYDYIEKISVQKLNAELNNSSYAADDGVNKELEELEKKNYEIELEDEEFQKEFEDEDENEDNQQTSIGNNSGSKTSSGTKKTNTISQREKMKQKYSFEKAFSSLKKINNETVGYLVVNNTEISYPIVQHSDNSYYLKHDFYKQKKTVGWIFMDYRNNPKNFDDNTIMYGHYSSGSGIMFGSLKNTLNSKWRSNKENMIISYDTEYGSYKFKIFAAYKVDYTTDYLVTNFDGKDEFDVFVNMITGRSVFKGDVTPKYGDKILTLSTCAGGGNKRLVVHAVLIEEE